jgi:hypothetical protein
MLSFMFRRLGIPCLLAVVAAGTAGPEAQVVRAGGKQTPAHQAAARVAESSAWYDLAGDDPARLARAAVILGRSPTEAVAFFKRNLRPVKMDAKLLRTLVAELDNDDSSARAAAQEELEYFGKYVRDDLKKTLVVAPSAEVRKRIQQLIERIDAGEKQAKPAAAPAPRLKGGSISVSNVNGQITILIDGVPLDLTPRVIIPIGPPRGWMRAVRAIGILEAIDTADARKLLETLAQGEADALPTVEARAALTRLGKK